LLALDGAFFAFHTALVLFNVFGWIPKRTRKLNLACLLLTAASWFLMGLWHGIGYCLLTDLHWQVRHALGIHDPDHTYIQLLIRLLTGWEPSDFLVETFSGVVFAVAFAASLGLNIADRKRARAQIA